MYEAIIKRKIARLRYIGVENTTIKDKNVINRLLGKVEYGNIRRGDWLMNVYNLNVKVYLLKDIILNKVQQSIASAIDLALSKNKYYLQFHNDISYKFYCNNGLYPLELDGVYKEDNIYTFQIRTIDKELAKYLMKEFRNVVTNDIKILKIDLKIISKKHIDKIFSITPVVIKNHNGYWREHMSLKEFEERIKINLIKKYNKFTGKKIDENFEFYTAIEFKNRKPISVDYKNIKLLGDKLQLTIADDEVSQKIAYMALGTGLGENNARGLGFVNFRWL